MTQPKRIDRSQRYKTESKMYAICKKKSRLGYREEGHSRHTNIFIYKDKATITLLPQPTFLVGIEEGVH